MAKKKPSPFEPRPDDDRSAKRKAATRTILVAAGGVLGVLIDANILHGELYRNARAILSIITGN
ncbi:hypothetical protein COW64_17260 [bacterium (Candidatus Blackallbacteria) CG18_big_fil_WC_8_21_14_2_50_49_26]|nr:MAG: hypothetical protein COW64_17260 [bacterium (Candidatus Blackallbacteria) CG18_big_fil_WC_8_21_14_2_50_49_26]